MAAPVISVCICTFRRQSVRETIESIARQKVSSGISYEVIVVDNDVEPSARTLVEDTAAQFAALNLTYVHAPARNISIARNACLDHAKGEWIAFIDDDEVAIESWLQNHYDKATRDNLDLSFGPVVSIYPDHAPDWIQEIDSHSTRVGDRRPILTGYSGNAFFKRGHPGISQLRFSEERGRTGGEDTEFFHQCFLAGTRIDEASEAVVYEAVMENRLSFDWMAKNKFRAGITYGKVIVYQRGILGNLSSLTASIGKVAYLTLLAGLTLGSKADSRQHFLRAIFHSGVVAGFFAVKEAEHYGKLSPSISEDAS